MWPDWAIFTLWVTFQSPWQQLFVPNCQHILGNFCKFVKIFHFMAKSFLGNFKRHLATFYWSRCSLRSESADKYMMVLRCTYLPSLAHSIIPLYVIVGRCRLWKRRYRMEVSSKRRGYRYRCWRRCRLCSAFKKLTAVTLGQTTFQLNPTPTMILLWHSLSLKVFFTVIWL